jgi:hypothetical protein
MNDTHDLGWEFWFEGLDGLSDSVQVVLKFLIFQCLLKCYDTNRAFYSFIK